MTQYTKVWQLLEDEKRWWNGSDENRGDNRYCLGMAIHKIYGFGSGTFTKVSKKVGFLPGWNDAPARTHAEVLDLCKELDI